MAQYVAGSVKGMASGDYLNGGSLYNNTTIDQCALSPLTFSNLTPLSRNEFISSASCHDSALGGYSLSTTTPNVRSNFVGLAANNNLPNNDLASVQSGVYSSGNVNLTSSSTIPDNRSIIIISSGTVTIGSDIITKLDNVTSIDQISQIIIVANEIDIKSNVQRVDAWLVAKTYDSNNNATEKGILNTCYDPSDNIISDSSSISHLNSDVCNKQLTINGPVSADKIFFYRTAGSDVGSESESAETINLPASTFLWSKVREKGADSAVTTVYQTEKPVRY